MLTLLFMLILLFCDCIFYIRTIESGENMALMMNDTDMDRMLEEIRPKEETYRGKAWGTILAETAEVLTLGAFSNTYCYLGVSEHYLVIAIVGTLNIDRIKDKVCLPFEKIESVSIKRGIIPSQRIIKIKGKDIKLKISLVNNHFTTKVKNQKEGMDKICETLKNLK